MDGRKVQLTPSVIDAINEELAYQTTLIEQNRTDGIHYGTAGQLLTLLQYADLAAKAWVNNPSDDYSLQQLRKCAAVAIRALLTEGCPRRGGKVFIAAAPEVGAGAGD